MRSPARSLLLCLSLASCTGAGGPGELDVGDAGGPTHAETGTTADSADSSTGLTTGPLDSSTGDPPEATSSTGEPTTTTGGPPPAGCGDGEVVPPETCDDGPNNADDGACTSDCRTAVCGDGLVREGVEACDDGNGEETDACLSNCQPATCGDGFVHVGVEACDDGNNDEADKCSKTCQPTGCNDGTKNGSESDIDCGGPTCGACDVGDACVSNFDCDASVCKQGVCVPPLPLMPPGCSDAKVTHQQAYAAVQGTCNCHGNGPGGLTFSSAGTFRSSMVGVTAQIASMKLVTAGDIDQSYLLYKVLNQQDNVVRGGDSPMPIGKILSDAQKCMLINWVKSGAT